MVQSKFRDFFSDYLSRDFLPDEVANADVVGMTCSKEEKKIVVRAVFDRLVPYALISKTAEAVKEAIDANSFIIEYSYECDFDDFAAGEVLSLVLNKNAALKGLLGGAKVQVREKNVNIFLNEGGKELLVDTGFVKDYKQTAFEKFGVRDINVIFDGNTATDVKQLKEELSSYVAEKKTQRSESSVKVDKSVAPADGLPIYLETQKTVYGRDIKERPIRLSDVDPEMGSATVWGTVFSINSRETWDKKSVRYSYFITDKTSSYMVSHEPLGKGTPKEKALSELKEGQAVVIHGLIRYDDYLRDNVIKPDSIATVEAYQYTDTYPEKRVELHMHTNMSTMDATASAESLIKRAASFGHRACAITDHGVAQAYPEIMNTIEKINKDKEPDKRFKAIYGIEAYMTDDTATAVNGSAEGIIDGEFVVFDVETTGRSYCDRITQIGAIIVKNGELLETFSTLVNPGKPIPEEVTNLTGITDDMVKNAPAEAEAIGKFLEFAGGRILVAHNAEFDISFLSAACERSNIKPDFTYIDTLLLSRKLVHGIKNYKLDTVVKALGLRNFEHHRADEDAKILGEVFIKLLNLVKEIKPDCSDVHEIDSVLPPIETRRLPTYHFIILVKNMKGLKNLYKLISLSHLKYFKPGANPIPVIPKSELNKFREGLIFGSACEAGELFREVLLGMPHDRLLKTASYYDYLEIQPNGNNMFLVREKIVDNEEVLCEINKKIISLADELGKLVCATGDVHFLNREDECF
ncbi:MAG: exonuclease domain-containing protein, partial [Acutalibacteraceae bacterium]